MSYRNSLSDPERNTMVLTEAQTTTFYEGADKMAIPNTTVLELSNKGLQTVNELSEFDKMSIKSISHNQISHLDHLQHHLVGKYSVLMEHTIVTSDHLCWKYAGVCILLGSRLHAYGLYRTQLFQNI